MLVDETERSALLLGPEQPHEAGWFLLIDTGVNASAESIGFVDLVVRQGELWRPLSPGRWRRSSKVSG